MKKIITIMLSSLLCFTWLTTSHPLLASENEGTLIRKEEFELDSRSYSLSLYSDYSQVETTDLITGITDIIIYRVAENALYINGIKTSENVVKLV